MTKVKFSSIYGKDSLIDDVSLTDENDQGNPILFTNQEIRRMLSLAEVNGNDVFLDLGCGWGQNLIIALTEFNVKRAVGFENNLERNTIANKRLERLTKIGIDNSRYLVTTHDFDEEFLRDKIKDIKLSDATVIFYGLSTSKGLLNKIKERMRRGCRLICYFNCLFPEIMPDNDKIDFPFYVHTFPFKKTTSEEKWLSSILQKKASTISKGKKPLIDELWDELYHDYDVYGVRDAVKNYKNRLRLITKQK